MGGQRRRQLGAERGQQRLGLGGVAQAHAVERQRVEEDLGFGAPGHLRQLHKRTTGDLAERVGVRHPGYLRDVDKRQVDVPQNQPVNLVPPVVTAR